MSSCYFHHVAIHVVDYDKSLTFYYALGMEMYTEWIADEARHCFLSIDGKPYLELHETKGRELIESRLRHFCFHVDNVDEVYALAIANGATSKVEPHDHPLMSQPIAITNARVSHIYGPDGESIEIINWGQS